MKIAVVYNHSSENVINLFGIPNRESIARKTIKKIADGLKKGGHQVRSIEGDKDIVERLEEFMPRVLKGERPGMVFNVSYGIQGQARYTHIPSILEMVGIPYIGSGPLAHSLALDKVVAKMLFRQHGISTPDFAVLDAPGFPAPDLEYPLIVKPKNEAMSFGMRIVENEKELREAADIVFQTFRQPVLVEQLIEGREINIGLLGNNPPDLLPAVELVFGPGGPAVYTYEDKVRTSGREIDYRCPAPLDEASIVNAQGLARRAFKALGCYDCARVDMRLDNNGNLYVLELNSLPSLGEHGSYTIAAEHAGLDFTALVNRLVEVASARYFGTPSPPEIVPEVRDIGKQILSYLIERRDQIEHRAREWTTLYSQSSDPAGIQEAFKKLARLSDELGLKPVKKFTDRRYVCTWETRAGLAGGTLLIGHLDVPVDRGKPTQAFRRDPEWLYGEGIGVSRAPLAMLEFALRSLRSLRQLRRLPIGILYYADEGQDCLYSAEIIRAAAAAARRVLVLRPGNLDNRVVTQRRGWRRYRLIVEDEPRRPGKVGKRPEVLRWVCARLEELAQLSSRENRISVATSELRTEVFPHLLPHRLIAMLLVSYSDRRLADVIEKKMREILGRDGHRWNIELICDRPPMKKRKSNTELLKVLTDIASRWEIPFSHESSLWPSVAGLVPAGKSVICGIGPVARDLDTPKESVQRISLLQRTLLLAQYFADQVKK